MADNGRQPSEGKRSNVGLYSTLIFHLTLLIVLLCCSIGGVISKETSFVLDFTKQEQREKEQKEVEFKQSVSDELDRMIAEARKQNNVRNVAVDAGSRLRDNSGRRGEKVYDEARELQKRLDASKRDALRDEASLNETVDLNNAPEESDAEGAYRGPSVISYTLDGRKGRNLSVPAYKWYGGGDVAVEIVVNRKGRVIAASVIESLSTPNENLHHLAVDAAKRSRFSSSESAPEKQIGQILYRFLEQ